MKTLGILITSRIEQIFCPVVTSRIHDELTVWDRLGDGLDFSPARLMSLNNAYVRALKPQELLGKGEAAIAWDRVDLAKRNRLSRRGEAKWEMPAPTTVYGLAVWWTAELTPGVSLTTSPLGEATHWEQLYLPCVAPIRLRPGETLAASINSRSSEEAGTDIAWTLSAIDAKGKRLARHAMSLEQGFLP
jgi:protein arginine N-methyltransferase 1